MPVKHEPEKLYFLCHDLWELTVPSFYLWYGCLLFIIKALYSCSKSNSLANAWGKVNFESDQTTSERSKRPELSPSEPPIRNWNLLLLRLQAIIFSAKLSEVHWTPCWSIAIIYEDRSIKDSIRLPSSIFFSFEFAFLVFFTMAISFKLSLHSLPSRFWYSYKASFIQAG